jgi:hypothetical protein
VLVSDPVMQKGIGSEIASRNICIGLIEDESATVVPFETYGKIELHLTEGLWNAWSQIGTNIEIHSSESMVSIQQNTTSGCINGIDIADNMLEQIGVRFVFSGDTLSDTAYRYRYRLYMTTNEGDEHEFGCASSIFDISAPTASPIEQAPFTAIKKWAENDNSDFVVYPNPANNRIKVEVKKESEIPNIKGGYSVSVTDMLGREMESSQITASNGSVEFNTSSWNDGIYFVRMVSADKGTSVVRIEIIH